MSEIGKNQPGARVLVMGNEAIARGFLEGGVQFCAAYPGNPSSEILESIAAVAPDLGIWAEWSVNEKVALEGAAAASFAGVRSMAAMKQNGVNVAMDFITNLALSGVKAGLVLVTCDDPGAISSTNEEDARFVARVADLPLLEPAFPEEAMSMAKYALELSETLGSLCVLRSVSRLSHSREAVVLGTLPDSRRVPEFDVSTLWKTFPVAPNHQRMHRNMAQAEALFEDSAYNWYEGPDRAELMVITCGNGYLYSREAVELLDLGKRVGVVKLGTTWPLPRRWLTRQLDRSERILFVEEVDPFLEEGVKAFYAQNCSDMGPKKFHGRVDETLPKDGEMSPDLVMTALVRLLNLDLPIRDRDYAERARAITEALAPPRAFGFCPGCPHRASFWSIKNALKLDARNGFVSGDIGCYTLSLFPTGFSQSKLTHCMGSGLGVAGGFMKLRDQGFDQPVISVVGDSTFFHSGIPPLVDAIHHGAEYLLIILDNSATAMTGFQPHPGLEKGAMGPVARALDLEAVCRSLGASVTVQDPYDLDGTREVIYRLLNEEQGVRVLILRRTCALVQRKQGGFPYTVQVDPEKCTGDDCGCNRYCTRVFRCPGLYYDRKTSKTVVDEVICVGCGVCADICPQGAISREELNHAE